VLTPGARTIDLLATHEHGGGDCFGDVYVCLELARSDFLGAVRMYSIHWLLLDNSCGEECFFLFFFHPALCVGLNFECLSCSNTD
jgi:hypothetical protein